MGPKASLRVRIYALGLLQTIVVLGGFALLLRLSQVASPEAMRDQEHALAAAVEADLDDAVAVQRHLDGALEKHELEAEVLDEGGVPVASTVVDVHVPCVELMRPQPLGVDGRVPHRGPPGGAPPPGAGPPPPGGGPPHPPRPPTVEESGPFPGSPRVFCYALPLSAAGAKIVFRRDMPDLVTPFGPEVIGLTLLVVALVSWLLLRTVVKPLRRLGDAATAFGAGDLDARTNIVRADEFGDVAAAFDTMAQRIADLVRGERELIANISHELRTPLARIRVALDLATESGSQEAVQASLADVVEDLDELEQLVADVLDSARPLLESAGAPGTPTLHVTALDAEVNLRASVERFSRLYPDRSLDARLISVPIRGDKVLLRRMVDNLLDNAQKFSDGPVALTMRFDENALLVVIEDRGIGIASGDLERVFRPFFRTDKSRARKTGGTGLGLGLARRIAEAHGGTLTLDSTLGEGTRVYVRLPVHVSDC